MPAANPPSALTVSVSEVLRTLDHEKSSLARGIAEGRYALWLGSAISRERVADLSDVLLRVLEFLQVNVDPTATGCPFKRALDEALALAELGDGVRATIDTSTSVRTWPHLDAILHNLVGKYSSVLDISLPGQPPDYLLWTAVDIEMTYGSSKNPDCEHMCIAVLIHEGAFPEIASANWDGLIEEAVHQISPRDDLMRVCVLPKDFQEPTRPSRLLKFHGCAVRAVDDPRTYRDALVGRESQITNWPNVSTMMRNQVVDLATTRPTLMIGLSGQDSDIRDVFSKARQLVPWPWPSDPPAQVFAEDAIAHNQSAILRLVYGADAYAAARANIDSGALVRAYGKPLLTAIVLHTVAQKLKALVRTVEAPSLDDSGLDELEGGITCLRDQVARLADGDRNSFIRAFIEREGRLVAILQAGALDPATVGHYRPLSRGSIGQIPIEPSNATSGFREFAAALALLGLAESDGTCTITLAPRGSANEGSVEVSTRARASVRLFLVVDEAAVARLTATGAVSDADEDAVIVYARGPAPRLRRTPTRRKGRLGRPTLRTLGVAEALEACVDLPDLRRRFKEAVL